MNDKQNYNYQCIKMVLYKNENIQLLESLRLNLI